MVFFSCDGCGDVLRKNQIDTHAGRCRGCLSVSCVDCLVSFYGDDYRAHTTCLTEAERYEKTDSSAKKKKTSPQEAWMHLVCGAANSAPPNLRQHFTTLASLGNVPRKPKPFRNFAANSLNLRGKSAETTVSAIWDHLSSLREQEIKNRAEKSQADSRDKGDTPRGKSMPEPSEEEPEIAPVQASKAAPAEPSSKRVRKAMKTVLKQAPNKKLSKKKIRKAVMTHLGLGEGSKKALKSMIADEASASMFVVQDDIIMLQ